MKTPLLTLHTMSCPTLRAEVLISKLDTMGSKFHVKNSFLTIQRHRNIPPQSDVMRDEHLDYITIITIFACSWRKYANVVAMMRCLFF